MMFRCRKEMILVALMTFIMAFNIMSFDSQAANKIINLKSDVDILVSPEDGADVLVSFKKGDPVFVTGFQNGYYVVLYQGKTGYFSTSTSLAQSSDVVIDENSEDADGVLDTILEEDTLPRTLTSYSPCFRKEKGAHGIEERGVYRIHQFEKQEMIVVCKPEDSKMWFDKLWQNTVDLFRSLDIPVRTLECCSGDLADLKVKSIDVEAWSPRQKKYFEVGSC